MSDYIICKDTAEHWGIQRVTNSRRHKRQPENVARRKDEERSTAIWSRESK